MLTTFRTLAGKLVQKVKRNPVLNAMLAAMVTQFLQDAQTNQIDWPHIVGYVAALFMGVWAREYVTPTKEIKGAEAIDN